jgi:hypothetical protein
MNQEDEVKTAIYGLNFLVGAVGKALNRNMAHPYAALFYGGLDAAGRVSNKIRRSMGTRLAHTVGAAGFGLASVLDVFSIAGGDLGSVVNFGFDASMAYQLGKDTLEDYNRGEDLVDDFKYVGSGVKGLVSKFF